MREFRFKILGTCLLALAMATGLASAQDKPAEALAVTPLATAPEAPAPRQGFPDANGPFSATMVLVKPETLDELRKPSDQLPILMTISETKVGDTVVALFMFSGVGVTQSQYVDLTYDLKIFAPDGKIYDGSDIKSEVALRGRLPGPQLILHNQGNFSGVRFEAKDQPGIYRFEAVLHDNVANRDIPLKAELKFVP